MWYNPQLTDGDWPHSRSSDQPCHQVVELSLHLSSSYDLHHDKKNLMFETLKTECKNDIQTAAVTVQRVLYKKEPYDRTTINGPHYVQKVSSNWTS